MIEAIVLLYLIAWSFRKWRAPWLLCKKCGDELDDSWGVTCWTCDPIKWDKERYPKGSRGYIQRAVTNVVEGRCRR